MNSPLTYLQGRFVPFAEASLPLHDAGFVSGATIVDNARTFRHRLFRFADHLARFRRDCEMCYVPLPASDAELTAAAEELVAHNAKLLPRGGELQLVTFATPGPLGVYLGEAANGPPTLGMVTYPLPFARYRRFFTEGVTLAGVGKQSQADDDLLNPRVKHRSRLFWHIAERRLRDPKFPSCDPISVPVVMNHLGLGDTAIGSILACKEGTVFQTDWGLLQTSVSAKVVCELCQSLSIGYGIGPIDYPSLCDIAREEPSPPSEVLLTGTAFCLAGVRQLDPAVGGRQYPWPGPVYLKLLAAWNDMVGVDIAGQILSSE